MFQSTKRTSNELRNVDDMTTSWTFSQAVAEASRCLLCLDAPCSSSCPADTDPGTFIRKLRLKNVKGAIRTIKTNNILGGACGIVCPVEELCQKSCSATEIDRPIEIGRIQRFLVELGWSMNFDPLPPKATARPEKVAIIGGGPAGLTCAASLAQAGFSVTVFEAKSRVGGNLRYGVPEFRLSAEFVEREFQDIANLGVEFRCDSPVGANGVDALLAEGYAAVFMGVGIWKPRHLEVPGTELENVLSSMDFLESMRAGRRDAIEAKVRGKNIAVVGGGSVAVDVACTSKALGANKVYILYRRSLKEMPASKDELQMARDNHVSIRSQSVVTKLLGEDGKLTGLEGIETDWDVPGVFTAENLRQVPGTEFKLKVETFVMALGNHTHHDTPAIGPAIERRSHGLVVTGADGVSTSQSRVFAGGDDIRGSGTVVEAVADGKKAAKLIIANLSAPTID